jgi:hypothetical protein
LVVAARQSIWRRATKVRLRGAEQQQQDYREGCQNNLEDETDKTERDIRKQTNGSKERTDEEGERDKRETRKETTNSQTQSTNTQEREKKREEVVSGCGSVLCCGSRHVVNEVALVLHCC